MGTYKNHTFVVCAYKESPYLEECIRSVLNQDIKTNVIVTTSTPNNYIEELTDRYSIPMIVNTGKSGIQEDWNFAYSQADTDYVTIAHQDDIYNREYTKELIKNIDETKKQIIFFSDYRELKQGKVIELNKNLKIKKILLYPMRFKFNRNKKIIKKGILSLGSSICCPSVTFNKKVISKEPFTSEMKCSLDWDTWSKFSLLEGEFVYINKELIYHRIHEDSETTLSIINNVRQNEDYIMFKKIWPTYIAKILHKFYSKSLESNNVEKK